MDSSTNSSGRIKRHLTIQPTKEEVQTQPLTIPKEQQLMTSFHLGEEVIGGFAAGVIGTLLGFPLDLVKTRYVCAYVMSFVHSMSSSLFYLDLIYTHIIILFSYAMI